MQGLEIGMFYDTNLKAKIIQADQDTNKKAFVVVDKPLFFHQEKGYPSDQGHLIVKDARFEVTRVTKENNQTRYYYNSFDIPKVNAIVKQVINEEVRNLNSHYHTAGQLLIIAAKEKGYKYVEGHYVPKEAYVIFKGKFPELKEQEALRRNLENKVNAYIQAKLSLTTQWNDDGSLSVQFGDEAFLVAKRICIHPSDLGSFTLKSFEKNKKDHDEIRINYALKG